MVNRLGKRSYIICCMLTAVFLMMGILLPVKGAKAEGEDVFVVLMFSDDDGKMAVGQTLTVTVSIKSEKAFSTTLYLNYPSDLFDFVSGEDGDFKQTGNLLGAELRGDNHYIQAKLQAKAAGEAWIYTSSGNVLDENGQQLIVAHAGAGIDIVDPNGEGVSSETGEDTGENTEEVTEELPEPDEDAVAEINGKQYAFVSLSADYIPEGFSEGRGTYKNWTVPAYLSPNKAIKLVALKDEEEKLYLSILEEDAGKLVAYNPVSSGTGKYILKDKPGNVTLPDGFTEAAMDFGFGEVKVYKHPMLVDMVLVYAINTHGTEGLFYYDVLNKSFCRYVSVGATDKEKTTEAENTSSNTGNTGTTTRTKDEGFFTRDNLIIITITLAALFVIMSIIAIVLMVKNSRKNALIDELDEDLSRAEWNNRNLRKAHVDGSYDDYDDGYYDDRYDDRYDDYDDGYYDDYDDRYDDQKTGAKGSAKDNKKESKSENKKENRPASDRKASKTRDRKSDKARDDDDSNDDDDDLFREGDLPEKVNAVGSDKEKTEKKPEPPKPLEKPVSGETIEIVMVDATDNNQSVNVPPAQDRKVDRVGEAMRNRPHGIDSAFDVVGNESRGDDAPDGDSAFGSQYTAAEKRDDRNRRSPGTGRTKKVQLPTEGEEDEG